MILYYVRLFIERLERSPKLRDFNLHRKYYRGRMFKGPCLLFFNDITLTLTNNKNTYKQNNGEKL